MELLQKHFDTALESPNGIKKLRELILSLAMRGKLVPQDPNDQPASELLKEIQVEKERIASREGAKARRNKELPPIKPAELPYTLPKGWVWTRLGEIVSKLGSGSTPSGGKESYVDEGIMFFRSQNIYNNGLRVENISYITPKIHEKMSGTKILPLDILFNITGGSLGRSALVPVIFSEGNISQHVCIIRPACLYNEFIHKLTISSVFQSQIPGGITGAGREGLQKNRMELFLIPLPPLAEQKRIVAKIDELMALCDTLEAQRKARSEKILEVHRAAIHKLLETPNTASSLSGFAPSSEPSSLNFSSSFEFLYSHFNPLYSVKENVTELKKAILTLAMQGRLVKQDPTDQPASELLKEIQVEKERIASREGAKARRNKELPPIKPEELPYEVPENWVWTRLVNVLDVRDGTHDTPKYVDQGIPLITSKNLYTGVLLFDDVKFISTEDHNKIKDRSNVDKGDILFAMIGSIGNPVIVDTEEEFSIKNVALFKFYQKGNPDNKFIHQFLHLAQENMKAVSSGAVQSFVSLGFLREYLFPLPPLAEQKRIVAKIDELMALCDKLEKQIDQATDKQTALFDAVLAAV